MENLRFGYKPLLAAALGIATLAGCATTMSGSSGVEEGCVDQETTYKLLDGESISVGVSDLSFKNGFFIDSLKVEREGDQIVFEAIDNDGTSMILDGVGHELSDEYGISAGSEPLSGQLIEEGDVVNFTLQEDGQLIGVTLEWICEETQTTEIN